MQLFPIGKVYNFMALRRVLAVVSLALVAVSLGLIFIKGPKLGTDFKGGTEVEVKFNKPVNPGDLRKAVTSLGFSQPDVVRVEEGSYKNRFLIRVQEVSQISEGKKREVERVLCFGDELPEAECPLAKQAREVKFSPGGDKIAVRYRSAPDLTEIRKKITSIEGIEPRDGENALIIQNVREHKVEIALKSKGDQLMDGLKKSLGTDVVPENPLRVEWIGPKAGAQLRDAALQSIAIALVFIMAYIAFRFDLRFAPARRLRPPPRCAVDDRHSHRAAARTDVGYRCGDLDDRRLLRERHRRGVRPCPRKSRKDARSGLHEDHQHESERDAEPNGAHQCHDGHQPLCPAASRHRHAQGLLADAHHWHRARNVFVRVHRASAHRVDGPQDLQQGWRR